MRKLEIPGDRDLPSGHLDARRRHLVQEVHANASSTRFRSDWFLSPRLMVPVALLLVLAIGIPISVDHFASDGTEPAAAAVKVTIGGATVDMHINVLRSIEARAKNGEAEIVGGSSEQRDLLRTIFSRMPSNSLTRVEIAPKVYMGKKGVALVINSLSDDFPRSEWEKMLVAGAFKALSADRGLTAVVGLPSSEPGYSPTTETATSIEANVRAAAGAAGADVVQLQVYQPDGAAPAVILKVADPGPFLKNRLPGFLDKAISDRRLKYEGTFVEVVDGDGAFVWESGMNSLANEGSVGTRPDLAGCSPVTAIGFGTTPACPVS